MREKWPDEVKLRAVELRKKGSSLGDIRKVLGVSKSTLHEWTKNLKRPANLAIFSSPEWARKIQPLAVKKLKDQKALRMENVRSWANSKADLFKLDLEVKQVIISMLYWAEGGRSNGFLQFSNTDPYLIRIFITLLRQIYPIEEARLRVQLYLHYYHPVKLTKEFWSDLLKIPLNQFNKIALKPRGKGKRFRKNYGGICAVRYNDLYLKERIVQLGYAVGRKLVNQREDLLYAPLAQRIERRPPES